MTKAARRLAEIPAGSWTKWLVMGFWVVVMVVALPLSAKLNKAEKKRKRRSNQNKQISF